MRRALLLLLLVVFAAAAGCSGGGGGDDDDDVATTPTDTPTPAPVAFCYVIWGTTSGGVVTEYYLDFPAAAWTTGGAVVIDDVDNWAELSQYDSSGSLIFSMVSTAGTITSVSAPDGLEEGDAAILDDDDAQVFTDYGSGLIGTAGAGNFTGVWSDPGSPLFTVAGKTLGTGTVATVAVSGTASVPALVGQSYAYAQCYELSAMPARKPARADGIPARPARRLVERL